jgi:hypothetical protein
MRIPTRLLPLAIRAVRAMKRALAGLESDLASLVEPETDRTCFECGTSDPTGFCPAHRVLDKGRVN